MHPARGSLQRIPVSALRLHDELQVRGLRDGQVLFQGYRLPGFHGFAAEHLAQGLVRHHDVRKIALAGILQFQGQLHGISRRAALLVRRQGCRQIHCSVFDGIRLNLGGIILSAGLVGDGRLAGQVLCAHFGREHKPLGLTGRNALDGSGCGGNVAVFLDGHVGHFRGARV